MEAAPSFALDYSERNPDEAGVALLKPAAFNPIPLSLAADLVNLAVSENIDFVIGCGGSVLDTQKLWL